jgi:hypothetical protein
MLVAASALNYAAELGTFLNKDGTFLKEQLSVTVNVALDIFVKD